MRIETATFLLSINALRPATKVEALEICGISAKECHINGFSEYLKSWFP